ncbi:sigma-70 family RNA polymerase sigma factor [uncultured Subdoligranulum sp.]|uniref:RNA polymerase sigma factor n=1 Tax=uncultured Subdoligranulum sp. TaxID=512298 RepID=UPI00342CBF62
MRSEQEINRAIEQYADTVRRICLVHLKNYADTEGIFQTVFVKYLLHTAPFASPEHERAWIIRVTLNACKDLLRSVFRRRTVSLEEVAEQPAPPDEHRAVLQAVQALPAAYRDVVYLHYYEGYTAPEIARILGKNVNVISVQGWNDDGTALAETVDVTHLSYTDAVETILSTDTIETLLAGDAVVEIGVIGDDDAHCATLLAGVEACTAGRQNAHCYRAGTGEVEAAHDCGLSYGKYRAYQELAALDPTVTPEQVADMTMREIRDRIAALSGTAPLQGTQSPAATSDSAAGDTGAQKEPGHHGAGHHGGDD